VAKKTHTLPSHKEDWKHKIQNRNSLQRRIQKQKPKSYLFDSLLFGLQGICLKLWVEIYNLLLLLLLLLMLHHPQHLRCQETSREHGLIRPKP
jgi:hypothetical protein